MSTDTRVPLDQIYRPGALADKLGVHKVTLWRWVRTNQFPPPIKLGDQAIGWRQSAVERWLESREKAG